MFDRYDIDRWLLWIWYLSDNLYKHCQHLRSSFLSMRPITSAQKENILSLASNGHSSRYIAPSLGVSQPTVSRVLQNLLSNHQPPHSGRPSKLSATSERSIVTQITTGKVANAVQATHHINPIISTPVSSQTVHRVLKRHLLKAVTKKKEPLLTAVHRKKPLRSEEHTS